MPDTLSITAAQAQEMFTTCADKSFIIAADELRVTFGLQAAVSTDAIVGMLPRGLVQRAGESSIELAEKELRKIAEKRGKLLISPSQATALASAANSGHSGTMVEIDTLRNLLNVPKKIDDAALVSQLPDSLEAQLLKRDGDSTAVGIDLRGLARLQGETPQTPARPATRTP
jgi:hypothetical protein